MTRWDCPHVILNEVLSITAQELATNAAQTSQANSPQ